MSMTAKHDRGDYATALIAQELARCDEAERHHRQLVELDPNFLAAIGLCREVLQGIHAKLMRPHATERGSAVVRFPGPLRPGGRDSS